MRLLMLIGIVTIYIADDNGNESHLRVML